MKSALLCMLLGFAVALCISPLVISLVTRLKAKQNILTYVDKHKGKQGTPTMGGIIFMLSTIVVYLSIHGYTNRLASIVIMVFIGYGLLGMLDDILKITHKQNEGLKAYQKALGQGGIAIIVAIYAYFDTLLGGGIVLPFGFDELNIGWVIIPFVIFVFVAITNAVNLTDGLDGLAGGVSVAYLMSFGVILYIYINHIRYAGYNDIAINNIIVTMYITFGLAGALLAFMCFNVYPAKIFMGDTGSLAIGGFIASSCVVTRLYLYMPIIGVMFVVSTISVIVQVLYYKATHKRIFKMAPLHHHFELSGMHETKIKSIYIIIMALN